MLRKDIPIGSHLVCTDNAYEHHGIYIGDDQVAHHPGWGDEFTQKIPIEVTSINKFHEGNTCYMLRHNNVKYKPQEIVERALSQAKPTHLNDEKYSLFFNNCEHFAVWCINGDKKSNQIVLNVVNVGQLGVLWGLAPFGGLSLLGPFGLPFLAANFVVFGYTSWKRLQNEVTREIIE